MSYFDELEAHGGLDPSTADAQAEAEQFREEHPPCGCGDPRCWLDMNEPTNVNVCGTWFNADCCGLCWNCGRADALPRLFPVGGGRLVHESCPTPAMEEDRERASLAGVARDDFNERRR